MGKSRDWLIYIRERIKSDHSAFDDSHKSGGMESRQPVNERHKNSIQSRLKNVIRANERE